MAGIGVNSVNNQGLHQLIDILRRFDYIQRHWQIYFRSDAASEVLANL